jgi:hypothetical protein
MFCSMCEHLLATYAHSPTGMLHSCSTWKKCYWIQGFRFSQWWKFGLRSFGLSPCDFAGDYQHFKGHTVTTVNAMTTRRHNPLWNCRKDVYNEIYVVTKIVGMRVKHEMSLTVALQCYTRTVHGRIYTAVTNKTTQQQNPDNHNPNAIEILYEESSILNVTDLILDHTMRCDN